jgi:integration host factor subunit beta
VKPIAMLTRGQLSRKVAHSLHISLNDAEVVVSTMIEAMTERLNNGEEIEIRGFGSFRFRRRHARVGRNPKTGKSVQVPSKKLVFFRPAFELRSALLLEGRFPDPPPAPEMEAAAETPELSRRMAGSEEACVPAEEENGGTPATEEDEPSRCCGPFAYQKKRFAALSKRIAELTADPASIQSLERALKDHARIQSWLAVHHHPSPSKSD